MRFNTEAIPLFVFFSTLFVYTGQRLYKVLFNHIHIETPRVKWMKANKSLSKVIVTIAGIGSVVTVYPLFDLSNHQPDYLEQSTFVFRAVLLGICAFISIFYVVRIAKKNLRELPFVKIFLVVSVYVTITCVLPVSSYENLQHTNFSYHDLFMFHAFILAIALYVFGIALLFDISDMEVDPPNQKTIPQVIGKKASLFISVLFIIPELIFQLSSIRNSNLSIMLFLGYILFFIGFWNFHKKLMYINFLGEGVLAIVGVVYMFV